MWTSVSHLLEATSQTEFYIFANLIDSRVSKTQALKKNLSAFCHILSCDEKLQDINFLIRGKKCVSSDCEKITLVEKVSRIEKFADRFLLVTCMLN